MTDAMTDNEPRLISSTSQQLLLDIARQALCAFTKSQPSPTLSLHTLPEELQQNGSSFVTLTNGGKLRGCIGSLEFTTSLAEDVQNHSVSAACSDHRFPTVTISELDQLRIEISILSQPRKLVYQQPQDLIGLLRPGIDGVVIKRGIQRATFLPQVWEKIPQIEEFLSVLCSKAGLSPNAWQTTPLEILTYQVESFHEDATMEDSSS
jgi:uncharacterized protein